MTKSNAKDWLFSMRFPYGEPNSVEQNFIDKTNYVTSKTGFVRECAYGGFILSELGILDLLVTEYRKGSFNDKALSERFNSLLDLLQPDSKPIASRKKETKNTLSLNANWSNLGQ